MTHHQRLIGIHAYSHRYPSPVYLGVGRRLMRATCASCASWSLAILLRSYAPPPCEMLVNWPRSLWLSASMRSCSAFLPTLPRERPAVNGEGGFGPWPWSTDDLPAAILVKLFNSRALPASISCWRAARSTAWLAQLTTAVQASTRSPTRGQGAPYGRAERHVAEGVGHTHARGWHTHLLPASQPCPHPGPGGCTSAAACCLSPTWPPTGASRGWHPASPGAKRVSERQE